MTASRSGIRLAVSGDGRAVRNAEWNVYLSGMSRVGDRTYWHLSVASHRRTHALTVKARGIWTLTPPDELLAAVREWLASGERRNVPFAEVEP